MTPALLQTIVHAAVVQGPDVVVAPPTPPAPGVPEIPFDPNAAPPAWVPYIIIAFFVMIAVIAIGVPLARAFARRMDRKGTMPHIPSEVSARLERIEQAVDSMAIEVERISEGQRFLTKLMGDLRALPAPNPLEAAQPLRVRAGDETR